MRHWLADKLLMISSGFHAASVWCKNRAIDVLIWPRKPRQEPRRSDGGLNIITKHTDIRIGDR